MAADADAAGELKKAETAEDAENTDTTEEVGVAADSEHEDEAVEDIEDAEETETADDAENAEAANPKRVRNWFTPVRLAGVIGLVVVLGLGGLVGWLGVRTYEMRQDQELRELFLRVGRQGAINLTTIDWQNVNNDIQRILDSATGPFYEDFSKRSQPFIDVVKKVQSKSVGTVTEAGIESMTGNEARVLVAISVKTSNLGAEDQPLRSWRMRLDVQRVDDGAKISNVLFVPA